MSVCVLQTEAGCSAQQVTDVALSRKTQSLGLTLPPLPASAPACGGATVITLPLKNTAKGFRPSKPRTLKLVATANGKPPKDPDRLVLRCRPNTGAGKCPSNPNGGPSELTMTVTHTGTDLDSGWTGTSHNFPVLEGTLLRACLTGCDASTNPMCSSDDAATDGVNGATFGPPLPLLAAGIPVCVVDRFATPKFGGVTANVQTGAIAGTINLLSDVFITTATQICPRCSGSDIRKSGTCDGGPRQGQACVTEGLVTVTTAPVANKTFTLSSDCPPPGTAVGTLTLALPVTSGSSMFQGLCPGQTIADACGGSACNATCTGTACAQTTSDGKCIDVKGGVSQVCCANDSTRPCFPSAGGGSIVRNGSAGVPAPAWPDATYPKTGDATLAATYCVPASGSNLVNGSTGLPGPGAVLLPVSGEWSK